MSEIDGTIAATAEEVTAPPAEFAMADEDTPGLAWPWRRYWARMVDLLVGMSIVSFVVGILRPSLFETGGLFDGAAGDRIFTVLTMPVAFVVDAIIYRVCGNSAGKALAGIRTVHENGSTMSLFEALKRNTGIWFAGLGMGIPFASLVTLVNAHGKGRSGKPCLWERNSGVRSFSQSDSTARTTLVALVFGALVFGLILVGQMAG